MEGSLCTRWYWWWGRAKVYYVAKNPMGFVGGTIICSWGALCSRVRLRARVACDHRWGRSWRGRAKMWVSDGRWCNYNVINNKNITLWLSTIDFGFYRCIFWLGLWFMNTCFFRNKALSCALIYVLYFTIYFYTGNIYVMYFNIYFYSSMLVLTLRWLYSCANVVGMIQ